MYNFTRVVNENGTITLSGLPPSVEVAIVVVKPDLLDWQKRMEKFMDRVQQNHPFAKMSKEEVLEKLRQTREKVYDELYGYTEC